MPSLTSSSLRSLLDQQRPATALNLLGNDVPPELAVYKAEALAAYHHLREAHPNEHNAYEKLGLLLALDGKTDEALALAERAVELGPFCPFSWATRGYVHFVRSDRALALADLQTAWGRADTERRRQANEYWWLLAALQGQPDLAEDRKRKAMQEATNSTGRRQVGHIEALLAGVAIE